MGWSSTIYERGSAMTAAIVPKVALSTRWGPSDFRLLGRHPPQSRLWPQLKFMGRYLRRAVNFRVLPPRGAAKLDSFPSTPILMLSNGRMCAYEDLFRKIAQSVMSPTPRPITLTRWGTTTISHNNPLALCGLRLSHISRLSKAAPFHPPQLSFVNCERDSPSSGRFRSASIAQS
jgi:hypothetical protein